MIHIRSPLLALVVGGALAGCMTGPGDGAEAGVPDQSHQPAGVTITPRAGETSEIHGQVVTYPEGDPIPGMSVVTFDVQARYEVFPTDADGRYAATGLRPGFYRIKAWPMDGQNHIGAYYDDTYFYCTGGLVDLRGGAVAEGIDFRLPHGGAIEGTIIDGATGEPMVDVRVDVQGLDYYNNNLDPTAYTDEDGVFRVVGLDSAIDDPETMNPVPGNYELEVTAPGRPVIYYPGVYTPSEAVPVGAIRGQTNIGIDLEIPTGGVISGLVSDQQGLPIEGGIVKAVHRVEPWIQASVSIAPGGIFAVGGLAPGEFTLEVTAGEYGALELDDQVALEEDGIVWGIQLEMEPEATVTGWLMAGDDPIEGGLVQAVPVEGVSATTWSLEDGSFVMVGLGAGEYYFYVLPGNDLHLPGYVCANSLCSSTVDATRLILAPGEAGDLGTVDCPPAATISGQVRQREGDQPLGRIYVTALPDEQGLPSMLAVSEEEDGTFFLGGLRPGTYSLSAEPYRYCSGDPGWVTTYSGDARRPETAGRHALAGAGAAAVDLTLPVDADGDAMSDVWEWLHFLDPARDDGLEDPDLDGTVNIDEYLERTDPRDDLGAGCAVGGHTGTAGAGWIATLTAALWWMRRR